REELDRLSHVPVRFDALVAEEPDALVFEKTVTADDPGVAEQRIAPRWPHHLPGELVIALTGQAGVIAARRLASSATAGADTASAPSTPASRPRCSWARPSSPGSRWRARGGSAVASTCSSGSACGSTRPTVARPRRIAASSTPSSFPPSEVGHARG